MLTQGVWEDVWPIVILASVILQLYSCTGYIYIYRMLTVTMLTAILFYYTEMIIMRGKPHMVQT